LGSPASGLRLDADRPILSEDKSMSDADLGQRALSALQWSYGGAVARVLAQLLVQLLLARLLGPESFGQATAALLVLGIGWILSEGGFGSALIQKSKLLPGDVSHALGWVLLLSCTTGAAVMASSPWLASLLGGPELAPLIAASGALIPVQALSNIPASLMRRELDMRRPQFIYMGGYIAAYGLVGLPLAWWGAGAWSLVAAFGVHAVINLLGSYAVVRHTLRPTLHGDRALSRFGLQVTGTNAANWLIENVDRLLVNRLWGVTALGEYSAAGTLSRAPANFLMNSMQSVTFASASRVQDDLPRMARSYLALLGLITLITCPLFALLAVHAESVVHLAYGERWIHAAPLFAAFCVGIPFYAVLSLTGPLLWALDSVRQQMAIELAGALLIALGYMALAGTSLAHAVWLIPAVYALRAASMYSLLASRLKVDHRKTLRAVFGGLALAVIVLFVAWVTSHWSERLPAVIASAALSVLLCWATVRLWPHALLAPELSALLRNRAGDSALLGLACRLIGLSR
jgi:PST family polysaccharide transporter